MVMDPVHQTTCYTPFRVPRRTLQQHMEESENLQLTKGLKITQEHCLLILPFRPLILFQAGLLFPLPAASQKANRVSRPLRLLLTGWLNTTEEISRLTVTVSPTARPHPLLVGCWNARHLGTRRDTLAGCTAWEGLRWSDWSEIWWCEFEWITDTRSSQRVSIRSCRWSSSSSVCIWSFWNKSPGIFITYLSNSTAQ